MNSREMEVEDEAAHGPDPRNGPVVRSYLIEAQGLFIFALRAAFEEAGLDVQRVARTVDIHDVIRAQPNLLFIDIDFVQYDAIGVIELLRAAVPSALLCVYTSVRSVSWSTACHNAGANAVFSKAAKKPELVEGLRRVLATGAFIDSHFE